MVLHSLTRLCICFLFLPNAFGWSLSRMMITPSIPTSDAVGIDRQCALDSARFVRAVAGQQERWALEMFEATGTLSEEFTLALIVNNLSLNAQHEPGLFDQCLSVLVDGKSNFHGKYCTVFFNVDPSTATDGPTMIDEKRPTNTYDRKRYRGSASFCLPSSCTAKDLRMAVSQLVGKRRAAIGDGVLSLTITAEENQCHTTYETAGKNSELDTLAMVMIAIVGFLLLLSVTATVHRAVAERSGEKVSLAVRLLHCFCITTNARTLMSTKVPSTDSLLCLNGIRVLSTIWVVMMHICQEMANRHAYNRGMMIDAAREWQNQFFQAFYAVDGFFLLSGLLVSYSLLRDLDRNGGRFDLVQFYLHRYVRLTPVYAFVFAIFASLMVHLGSGPDWNYVRYMSEDCRNNWWAHMTYISNYVPIPISFCMQQTWSLAVDMQMFWLSPMIIYPLWKWRRVGLAWAVVNMMIFSGATAVIHYAWNLPPTIMNTRPTIMEDYVGYLNVYYRQAYPRFPGYVLGLVTGWLLHKTKNLESGIINKWTATLAWTLSFCTCLTVMFGLVPLLSEDTVPVIDSWISVTYGSLHRLAWVASLSWLIFACVHGYGGVIGPILSSRVFLPLSKLTYIVYLTHYNYIKMGFSYSRTPFYFKPWSLFFYSLELLLVSFTLAAVIHVTVELPCLKLSRILLPARGGITAVETQSTPCSDKRILKLQEHNGAIRGEGGREKLNGVDERNAPVIEHKSTPK